MRNTIKLLLAAALLVGTTRVASAALLNFDFTLVQVGGPEKVTGEITGLSNNATSTPSHFYIQTATSGFPATLPIDLASLAIAGNTVTVTNDKITGFSYVVNSTTISVDLFTGFDLYTSIVDGSFEISNQDSDTSDPLSAVGFTASPAPASSVPAPPALPLFTVALASVWLVRRRLGTAAA